MANEAAVQSELIKQLLLNGALPLRITNITGCPDVIACTEGRFIGLECKDDMNGAYQQTRVQKIFQGKIERAGGLYVVVDQYNIDTILNDLFSKKGE